MEPVTIHFLDMPRSEAVEGKIGERAGLLTRFCADIQRCEVWVESPHKHHRKGSLYGVRMRLAVPGEDLEIHLQPNQDDVYVAIREAFDAARRQLEDYQRRRRGEVKAHPRAESDRTHRRQVPVRARRS